MTRWNGSHLPGSRLERGSEYVLKGIQLTVGSSWSMERCNCLMMSLYAMIVTKADMGTAKVQEYINVRLMTVVVRDAVVLKYCMKELVGNSNGWPTLFFGRWKWVSSVSTLRSQIGRGVLSNSGRHLKVKVAWMNGGPEVLWSANSCKIPSRLSQEGRGTFLSLERLSGIRENFTNKQEGIIVNGSVTCQLTQVAIADRTVRSLVPATGDEELKRQLMVSNVEAEVMSCVV